RNFTYNETKRDIREQNRISLFLAKKSIKVNRKKLCDQCNY
uniref:Uncharacterized protein n=1 Tax=Parascaris equorum TaxID=6256 RepID=A0A914RHY2_PAREQ